MGEGPGGLEENLPIVEPQKMWGLRPWKRHSTILLVVGFLFVLIGLGYILAKPMEGRTASLRVILQVAPIQFWGALFVLAGLLSMLSSRWPPMTETWGYMVLTGTSSGWAATYLLGWLFFHSPVTNLGQAAVWSILAFMWWAISGLPNPEKIVVTDGRL